MRSTRSQPKPQRRRPAPKTDVERAVAGDRVEICRSAVRMLRQGLLGSIRGAVLNVHRGPIAEEIIADAVAQLPPGIVPFDDDGCELRIQVFLALAARYGTQRASE